jgi:cytochrome c oxidase subunit 2
VGDATATHHTGLEISWSIPPLVVMMAFFVWGFKGFVDMKTPPKDALEIHATARKWNWEFTYPNGESDSMLHVPVGRDVRILIQSMDVLHSLYIPAFRVKMDAVPGRYTDLWFRATEQGKYPIFCTEYCGTSHSDMLSEATVETQATWDDYVDGIGGGYETPVALGEAMYSKKGCAACHSIDGSRKVGPSWKGIFGSTHKLADGSSVTVDENYIRESILEPNAKITEGFAPSMPTYKGQLDDKKINGLVEYIKSLK